MTTDPEIRDRLRSSVDPLRLDPDDALAAFHRVRPRRQRVRRAATIATALGIAALAFAATWLAAPFGDGETTPATPTGVIPATEPTGTVAYMVILQNGGASSIATSTLGGDTRTPIDLPAAFTAYPVLSPDGTRIAYASGEDYDSIGIAVANVDGTDADGFEASLRGPGIAWSPDGTTIAYVGGEDGTATNDVRFVGADGSDDHPVLPGLEWQSVSWSPDGQRLLVVGHPVSEDNIAGPAGWDVYTASIDGSGLRPLTSTEAWEHAATWSPDGSAILFTRSDYSDDVDYDQDVWVMDADGSDERRLTDWPGFDAFPTWSPDGGWIVFASDRDATPEQQRAFRDGDAFEGVSLFVMRSDGTDVRRVVTAGEGEVLLPGSWAP